MALTVTVRLLTSAYEAADAEDREFPEWPPHPARLFCALVAAARGAEDRAALTWLEQQPPPVVCAAGQVSWSRREAYVVTNEVVAAGGSQTHPGRTNQLRVRLRSLPAVPLVRFVWTQAADVDAVLNVLDAVARRVPYLGRSTGFALVSAGVTDADTATALTGAELGPERDPDDGRPGWAVFEPCALDDAEVSLRVPYPGYLDELDALFAAGRSSWEANRARGYRLRRPVEPQASDIAPQSVYPDVVVLRFQGLRPSGALAGVFTEALRSRVLTAAGRQAPAVLHGHEAPGRPHVAFLALPDVGNAHADGHLLGLGVAVPELPADQRRAVLTAILGLRRGDGSGVVELKVPGIGVVELAYQPGLVRPWGAAPERWRRGSRHWATATPVVLDRFPRNRGQEVDVVLRSTRMLGLPDPVAVQISTQPLLPGAIRLRPQDLPRQMRGRLFRHLSLTFDRPVAGPMLLGAGRYLGIGLLAPVAEGRDA